MPTQTKETSTLGAIAGAVGRFLAARSGRGPAGGEGPTQGGGEAPQQDRQIEFLDSEPVNSVFAYIDLADDPQGNALKAYFEGLNKVDDESANDVEILHRWAALQMLKPVEDQQLLDRWAQLQNLRPAEPGFWGALANWLGGYRDTGPDLPLEAYLPLLEVHCPAIVGCKTTASFVVQTVREKTLSVRVLFNEFGGGRKFSISEALQETVNNGKCQTTFIRAKIVLARMTDPQNPRAPTIYTVKALKSLNDLITRQMILGPHYCHVDPTALIPKVTGHRDQLFIRTDDRSDVSTVGARPLASESLSTFKFGFAIDLPDPNGFGESPVSAKFSVSAQTQTAFATNFEIAGGAIYYFFRPYKGSAAIQCAYQQ